LGEVPLHVDGRNSSPSKKSGNGIEVDKAKIEGIPPPRDIEGKISFLGHSGYYRRFIKKFKVSRPFN
jgi:hypothetical protein